MLLLWLTAVLAGTPPEVSELEDAVIDAISAVDAPGAERVLAQLDEALATAKDPLQPATLARRYQLEAAIQALRSRPSEVETALVQAIILDPSTQLDPRLLADRAAHRSLEAARRRAAVRPTIDPGPLGLTAPGLHVDGKPLPPGARLPAGRHHVQAPCADGRWSSAWTQLEVPSAWWYLCPADAPAAPAPPPLLERAEDSVATLGVTVGWPTGAELSIRRAQLLGVTALGYSPLRPITWDVGAGWAPGDRDLSAVLRGGLSIRQEGFLIADGYLYWTYGLEARWDPRGPGPAGAVGLSRMENFIDGWWMPRAWVGWQF